MRRPLLLLLLVGALAACQGQTSGGAIVVPGPAGGPTADPSPLTQAGLNTNHIHALALGPNAPAVLVATHRGVELVSHGASPRPLNAPSLEGDVLQVAYGVGGAAFASGHNLGIQVSHDGGVTWAPVSPDVAGLDVHGMAIDQRNPVHMVAYAVGKGVLRSDDAGQHWTHKAGYADSHYLSGMAITADGTLLAGSPELGVAASPDGGATFIAVRNGTGRIYSISAAATSADVVVVAAENGIFLTQDGGKDWSVGVPIAGSQVTGIAIDPLNASHLLAGDAAGAVFSSADSGTTWSPY